MPSNKNGGKKNPWGSPGNDDSRGSYNGGGGSNGGGAEPPDLDEMLRKAQENFGGLLGGDNNAGKFIGLGILAATAIWAASGLFIVQPGHHAVVQRFGEWTRTQAEPGLGYHFPFPIERANIINVEETRTMNIGFISRFARGGAEAKQDVAEESLMLTSDRNIVDIDLVIQWNIKSSENFLFEIREQQDTIKKVAESAVREVVGQMNMFPIITQQRQMVADRTREILQKNLDEYESGVNIKQVLIEKAEVHPDVQNAFQDVQSAKQDAEDVQNRAEAYREDIIPKARGLAIQMTQEAQAYKESVVARSTGDAERFNAVYDAYLTGKDVTKERIYIETMEKVLKNANKIILDNEGGSGVVPYLPLNELGRNTNNRGGQ